MTKPFNPLFGNRMLHGADYNPEQWLAYPDVFEKDLAYMKEAEVNVVSVGIFSWVSLEPEEGHFTFEWMDHVLHRLAEEGISAFLATPTGARPAWMSQAYPEVLRTTPERFKNLHGERHNHCPTSPVYREKAAIMNQKLSERYDGHPAVIGWHISNEYGGECHCALCQEAFREWLQDRYGTLKALNHAWWTTFWSHTYTDWSQVESPSPLGEQSVHGLVLDWKRFVTDQTIDFYLKEVDAVQSTGSSLPITANFMEMELFEGLDYWKFAEHVDFVSWDSYPDWHTPGKEAPTASWTALNHDMMRSLRHGQPFLLMESTPSMTNWQPMSKLKKPGMHELSSLQAVAHGSDSVQYFQWRQSRGSSEKFHGAVIGHDGTNRTRVFQDVKHLGTTLTTLGDIAGTTVQADVCILYSWANLWAVKETQGPRNDGMHYEDTLREHYHELWKRGINIDFRKPGDDLSRYKLVIAPMMYMLTEAEAAVLRDYVHAGGQLLATYWSGVVGESDLVHLGGRVRPLAEALGVEPLEIDGLYDGEQNTVSFTGGTGSVYDLCEITETNGAEVLGTYTSDFYAGSPFLTKHAYGGGLGWYVAARPDAHALDRLYSLLLAEADVQPRLQVPEGVSVSVREDEEAEYLFIMNVTGEPAVVDLSSEQLDDVRTGAALPASLHLDAYDVRVARTTN
ncbi:beta-galactosidase [Alkalicoccus chagannorensis]|uniref:beta-galactosidase n=1 Tax=Alkalicoccus chagannorensis TaxID=427072 RepID=UPI00040C3AB6|nr:beta-galactosidase [Alkalicoccus chagannorensis]